MNVVYLRTSTDKQDSASQLDAITRAIGAAPDLRYQDTGSAFKAAKRPGLESLLADASAGKLNGATLWIFSLSRLSRKGTRDTLNTLDALEKSGVKVRSVSEPVLDTGGQFRDVILSLLSTVAKLESSARSDRMKAWATMKKSAGERIGRKPIGIDPAQLRTLVDQGASIGKIAATFDVSRNTAKKAIRALGILPKVNNASE